MYCLAVHNRNVNSSLIQATFGGFFWGWMGRRLGEGRGFSSRKHNMFELYQLCQTSQSSLCTFCKSGFWSKKIFVIEKVYRGLLEKFKNELVNCAILYFYSETKTSLSMFWPEETSYVKTEDLGRIFYRILSYWSWSC